VVERQVNHNFKKFAEKVLKFKNINDIIPVLKISLLRGVNIIMKIKRTVGGGRTLRSLNAKQAKKVGLFTLIMLFFCTVILGCAFLLPKNGDKLTAHAATIDVQPTITSLNRGYLTTPGGMVGGITNPNPATVSYSDLSTTSTNMNIALSSTMNKYVYMNNVHSTLDFDMAFLEFSMNVTVPAGGKITVQYKFDVTARKATDSTDGTSIFCAEFFHFGTGNKTTGVSPVDVSTLSFSTSSQSNSYSQIRVDGSYPTSVFGCSLSGDGGNISNHSGAVYPNMGSSVSGCAADSTGTYTTADIVYENDTANSITFKEYFGFMGCGGRASGSCHIFYSQVDVTTEKAEFEKVEKPQTLGADEYTYEKGVDRTFNITNFNASKSALYKVVRTDLAGNDTTLYEYDTVNKTVTTGTNPLSSNSCIFSDVGKYTLSFKPTGAVWKDTLKTDSFDLHFYILPKKLAKPTVATSDASGKPYTGAEQIFTLTMSSPITASNWKDLIKTTYSTTGVSDKTNGGFGVTDVGEYTLKLGLADEDNYVWSDTTWGKTQWDSKNKGGTSDVTLKVTKASLTTSLTCSKTAWSWNMGTKDVTITATITDFKLADHADSASADAVKFTYYYLDKNNSENPLTQVNETYDPATKKVTAVVTLPDNLPQGEYTFGVKPDESVGGGKNYSVDAKYATKKFTVDSKDFDPSVLLWTYTEDGKSSGKTLAQNGKLAYSLDSTGAAVPYSPQIQLHTDDYDHTDVAALDGTYSGDVTKSAVGKYKISIKLKMLDANSKFANPSNDTNISVSSDGKSVTLTLNWEIEKGTFDLSGIKWEYIYEDADGTEHKGDYDPANPPQYNDGYDITVRVKADSLPKGLALQPTYKGESKDAVGSFATTFDIANFDYDDTLFNEPDQSAATLTLNWEIKKKNIYKTFKLKPESYTNSTGSGKFYIQYLPVEKAYEKFIKYEYKDKDGNTVSLEDIKAAADPTNEKTYTVTASIDTSVTGYENVELVGTLTKTFTTGSNNDPATVTIGGDDGAQTIKATYDGKPHFSADIIKIVSEKGINISTYTLTYYKGGEPKEENKLADGTYPTDAGEYCLEVTLTGQAAEKYILMQDTFTFEIEKQEVSVSVGGSTDPETPLTAVYDGKNHFGADVVKLTGADGKPFTDYTLVYYKNSPEAGNELSEGEYPTGYGKYFVKVVPNAASASNFKLKADTFVIEIDRQKIAVPQATGEIVFNGKPQNLSDYLDDKYASYLDKGIIQPSGQFKGIRNAGSYTAYLDIIDPNYCWDYGAGKTGAKLSLTDGEITVSGTDVQAGYNWSIAPFKLDGNALWNTSGKEGAALNLPEWVSALVSDGKLAVGYRYYEDTASAAMENPELKGGSSYWVDAVLTGEDAGNFVFANGTQTSAKATYTVPQSGASAFFGKALTWAKNNWWILVAIAAAIILLIILICIIAHRRKTKEIREEKKALKEEEKRRKEEQREEEKRRKEQERELEKAKAEAELAKMRAGLGLGAGAAGMAMAAQQQPMQQQMPMQQPMMQMPQMMQMPMQMPQYPQYMPQQMPMQMPQYGEERLRALEDRISRDAEERARRADERALRAAEDRARMAEERAMRAEYNSPRQVTQFTLPEQNGGTPNSIPMDVLGALVVSALKNMGNANVPKIEEPKPVLAQSTDDTVITTPTVYPPDAVITTTTTVDTTKNKPAEPVSRDSDRDRNFDIDGFYDTFDKQDV